MHLPILGLGVCLHILTSIPRLYSNHRIDRIYNTAMEYVHLFRAVFFVTPRDIIGSTTSYGVQVE